MFHLAIRAGLPGAQVPSSVGRPPGTCKLRYQRAASGETQVQPSKRTRRLVERAIASIVVHPIPCPVTPPDAEPDERRFARNIASQHATTRSALITPGEDAMPLKCFGNRSVSFPPCPCATPGRAKAVVPPREQPRREIKGQLGALLLAGALLAVSDHALAIGFVQVNSAVPQTPQTSVSVAYTVAQTAGDLNVVIVGWADSTATVGTVTDSRGNAYQLAVGPTVYSGSRTLSTYYAANIAAASANTVTVTFTTAARYPDVRILEYSGIATTSPLDVTAAAMGSSTSASSEPVTTTAMNDLIVGADDTATVTSGPGSGYTSRVITSPDGDIAEDKITTTVGSYTATASISPSGAWIMQLVAFKGAPSGHCKSTRPDHKNKR